MDNNMSDITFSEYKSANMEIFLGPQKLRENGALGNQEAKMEDRFCQVTWLDWAR